MRIAVIKYSVPRPLPLLLICLLLTGCASGGVDSALDDVESYIIEHPDSALTVIESMQLPDVLPDRTRARYALLHSMALDKNFIDLTDDSLALIATSYYQDKGPLHYRARSFYYLGRIRFNAGRYDEAILDYTRAEEAAALSDSLYLGMILIAQADTYNCTYNSVEELRCAKEAHEIFTSLGYEGYRKAALYSLAVAFQNSSKYEEALSCYDALIKESEPWGYYMIEATLNKIHVVLQSEYIFQPEMLDELSKIGMEYSHYMDEKDYWLWAYLLKIYGSEELSQSIVSQLESNQTPESDYWSYRISKHDGSFADALSFLEKSVQYQNLEVTDVLKESAASYQRDYYKAEYKLSQYENERHSLIFVCVILFIILILTVTLIIVTGYIRKQRLQKEQYLQYADEMSKQLELYKSEEYAILKKKYMSLYKARFEALGVLCEQYLQAQGRTDIRDLMYRKVVEMIESVRGESNKGREIEAVIDADLNGVMSNLRNEMPRLKEVDYLIFRYLVIGFDATTISRILNITVNNVHARKHRLKSRIEDICPPHADQFLEMFK